MLFTTLCFSTTYAQEWTREDSLKLNRILKGNKEIEINKHELKNIQFEHHIINKPLLEPIQLNIISPDETLPQNAKTRYKLSMQPYKPSTPYNWDPIFHCKIVQVNGQWEPLNGPVHYIDQSRAYNLAVGISNQIAGIKGLRGFKLGHSDTYINGGTISGLDLMFFFEKRFWQFKQNDIRKRTQEVLKNYKKAIPMIPIKEDK